jgi:cytochrome c-type biogenesis protein
MLVALLVASETVRDGALLVAIPIAFAAGVVSFLSPCVLPLVPVYLSYITGMSAADLAGQGALRDDSEGGAGPPTGGGGVAVEARPEVVVDAAVAHPLRRVVLGSLGFVLGTAVVFVSFGALFGSFGRALREHELGLAQIFGVVTIILGLVLGGAFSRVQLVQKDVRIHRLPATGLLAGPLLGFTFALGWTPCIGPTLGSVLSLSASSSQASAARGAVLSLAYCLGLGIPLLLSGLAFNRAMNTFARIKRHYGALMVAGGAMLVVLGILQVTGVWTTWMGLLQTRFGGSSLPL